MALRDCGDGRAGGPVKPGKYSSAGPFGHNLSGADLRVKRTNCRGSRCDRHGIGYPPLGRDRSCAGTCRHARGRSRWVRAHFLVDALRGPSKPRSRPGLLLCAPSPRPTRTRRSQHVHSGCITGAAGGVGGNRVRADSRTGCAGSATSESWTFNSSLILHGSRSSLCPRWRPPVIYFSQEQHDESPSFPGPGWPAAHVKLVVASVMQPGAVFLPPREWRRPRRVRG